MKIQGEKAVGAEEEYLDVLQNIELAIVGVYTAHLDLADFQVDQALEALGRSYQREKTGGAPILPKSEPAKQVYQAVKGMCDWRLGRQNLVDEEGQPMSIAPLTVDEIQACIKRLRRSIDTWNKRSGTQGYLNYILQFVG
jgi:hypothetical protein